MRGFDIEFCCGGGLSVGPTLIVVVLEWGFGLPILHF